MENYRANILTGDWESIRRMESEDRGIIAIPHRPWSQVYFLTEGYNKMTEKQSQDMYDEVYKPIVDAQKEIAKNNKAILKEIKATKSASFYRGLKKYVNELTEGSDHTSDMEYKIVAEKIGDYQKEDGLGKEIKGIWCDQRSVGCEGDSYVGDVYIQMEEGKYFTVNYSM